MKNKKQCTLITCTVHSKFTNTPTLTLKHNTRKNKTSHNALQATIKQTNRLTEKCYPTSRLSFLSSDLIVLTFSNT